VFAQNNKNRLNDFLTFNISTILKTIKAMFSFLGRHCFFICLQPLFPKYSRGGIFKQFIVVRSKALKQFRVVVACHPVAKARDPFSTEGSLSLRM
jgi:FPC/CPF motif-containing protein YcgG